MPEKLAIARQQIEQMLKVGIAHPTTSAWSSVLHMVPKETGVPAGIIVPSTWLRSPTGIPNPTYKTSWVISPTPPLFTKLNLQKACYWILVAPANVPKTAITNTFGLFEFVRMPFGLRNAAQTFQSLIDRCFAACLSS